MKQLILLLKLTFDPNFKKMDLKDYSNITEF